MTVQTNDGDMAVAVEAQRPSLEKEVHRCAPNAYDVVPFWIRHARAMPNHHAVLLYFKRETRQPGKLFLREDLAVPFENFHRLVPNAQSISFWKCRVVVMVAKHRQYPFGTHEINALARRSTVSDDVACAQHLVDMKLHQARMDCLKRVDIAMNVTNDAV